MNKTRIFLWLGLLAWVLIAPQSTGPIALAQSGPGGQGVGKPGNSPSAVAPNAAVPGGPGFYEVNSFAFMPDAPSQLPAYYLQSIYNPGTVSGYFEAPVELPKGATIEQIVIFFEDSSTSTLTVSLYACPFDTAGCNAMVSVSSSTTPAFAIQNAVSTGPVTSPVVDPQSFTYLAQAYLPPTSTAKLYGVRIDYTYPTVLPVVMK